MILRNDKVQDKKFKSIENKHLKFLLKHSTKNGKGSSSKMILHFYATWKIPKQILPLQSKFNKFLQTYLSFLITLLFLIFVSKEIIFQAYIEMELKIFFIIIE